ncbi:MAG: class IV adenylate cyclase [Planctomycetota bacterium]
MYEVEQKFRVADPAALESRLVGLAARFREPVEQVDRYFAHPCRDFVKTDEALRLRRVGDEVAATWKGPRIDSASKTRRELELALAQVPARPGGPGGGQATLDRWTELLEALGFRRVRDVAKRRRAARVPWQGTEVEAALDQVDGIGDFLELELLAAEGEVPLATACIASLAQSLGCDAQERRSYLELVIAAGR